MRELPAILKLDVSGNPIGWIGYERGSYYYAKDLVAWAMGEVDITLHGGISRMTGLETTLTMNTIIAIKGKVNPRQHILANRVTLTNDTLFLRDRNICAYCGEMFVKSKLTRDHIIPTSKGGKDTWMNVVTACSRCNLHKGNKTPEEYGHDIIYLPYAPNIHEALILKNRKILADQYDFLIKGVPEHSRIRGPLFTH